MSALKTQLVKPIVVGLTSAVGQAALYDKFNFRLPVLNIDVSSPVFFGLLGFMSSEISEVLKNYLLPMLPQSFAASQSEAALISPLLHGGINMLAVHVVNPQLAADIGMEPLVLGVGAELVGAYSYDNFVRDYLQ
jgi:hypothetical protein